MPGRPRRVNCTESRQNPCHEWHGRDEAIVEVPKRPARAIVSADRGGGGGEKGRWRGGGREVRQKKPTRFSLMSHPLSRILEAALGADLNLRSRLDHLPHPKPCEPFVFGGQIWGDHPPTPLDTLDPFFRRAPEAEVGQTWAELGPVRTVIGQVGPSLVSEFAKKLGPRHRPSGQSFRS